MRRLRLLALSALAAAVMAGCAGASMDSELGERYGLNVVNEMPHAMIVSLDDGSSTRLLGTVGPERDERFVLYGTASRTVTVVARDEADTHTVRRTITLRSGETVEIRLGQD